MSETLADLERWTGHWQVATLEIDGEALPEVAFAGASITVTSDGRFATRSMGGEYAGRFEVNPHTQPKSLALHFESGPEAGNTNYGIYELSGDECLLCLKMSGGAAPEAFVTTPGSYTALETLRRTEEIAAPATEELELVPELQGEWAMLSCLRAGEPLPPSFVNHGVRRIQGCETTLHFGKQLFVKGQLGKDSDGSDSIRLVSDAVQLGIYRLEGDLLHTCLGSPGKPRPTNYASTREGGETYSTWRRR